MMLERAFVTINTPPPPAQMAKGHCQLGSPVLQHKYDHGVERDEFSWVTPNWAHRGWSETSVEGQLLAGVEEVGDGLYSGGTRICHTFHMPCGSSQRGNWPSPGRVILVIPGLPVGLLLLPQLVIIHHNPKLDLSDL